MGNQNVLERGKILNFCAIISCASKKRFYEKNEKLSHQNDAKFNTENKQTVLNDMDSVRQKSFQIEEMLMLIMAGNQH